jgi:hypothetical protein
MRERELINHRLANLPDNKKLFRINAGLGWTGKVLRHTNDLIMIKNPRPFHAAPKGWPDLVGWETIEITPEMVGNKVAVFVFEEVKATGRLSSFQKRFRDVLVKMGGIFRVIRPSDG